MADSTRKNAIITLNDLIEAGACEKSIRRFSRTFGQSLNISSLDEKQRNIISLFFPWDCAANKLLSREQRIEYTKKTMYARYVFSITGDLVDYQRCCGIAWSDIYENI